MPPEQQQSSNPLETAENPLTTPKTTAGTSSPSGFFDDLPTPILREGGGTPAPEESEELPEIPGPLQPTTFDPSSSSNLFGSGVPGEDNPEFQRNLIMGVNPREDWDKVLRHSTAYTYDPDEPPYITKDNQEAPNSLIGKLLDNPRRGFKAGMILSQLSFEIAPKIYEEMERDGQMSPATRFKYNELKEEFAKIGQPYTGLDWTNPLRWLGEAAEQIPLLTRFVFGHSLGKMSAAALFKATGTKMVPVVGWAASLAGTLGAAGQFYRWNAYLDMIDRGIPHDIAKNYSIQSALIEWGLDYAQFATLGISSAVRPGIFGWMARKSASKLAIRAMTTPTIKQAIARGVGAGSIGYVEQVVQEILQEIGNVVTANSAIVAAQRRGAQGLERIGLEEAVDRISTVTKSALGSFAVLQSWDFSSSVHSSLVRASMERKALGHLLPPATRDVNKFLQRALVAAHKVNLEREDVAIANSFLYTEAQRIEKETGWPWKKAYKELALWATNDNMVPSAAALAQSGKTIPVSRVQDLVERMDVSGSQPASWWLDQFTSGKSPVGWGELDSTLLGRTLASAKEGDLFSKEDILAFEKMGQGSVRIEVLSDALRTYVEPQKNVWAKQYTDALVEFSEKVRPFVEAYGDLLELMNKKIPDNIALQKYWLKPKSAERALLHRWAGYRPESKERTPNAIDVWQERVQQAEYVDPGPNDHWEPTPRDFQNAPDGLNPRMVNKDDRAISSNSLFRISHGYFMQVPEPLFPLHGEMKGHPDLAQLQDRNEHVITTAMRNILGDLLLAVKNSGDAELLAGARRLQQTIGPKAIGEDGYRAIEAARLKASNAYYRWQQSRAYNIGMEQLHFAGEGIGNRQELVFLWDDQANKANRDLGKTSRWDRLRSVLKEKEPSRFKMAEWRAGFMANMLGVFPTRHYSLIKGSEALNVLHNVVTSDWKHPTMGTGLLISEGQADQDQDAAKESTRSLVGIGGLLMLPTGSTLPGEPPATGLREKVNERLLSLGFTETSRIREALDAGGVVPRHWGVNPKNILSVVQDELQVELEQLLTQVPEFKKRFGLVQFDATINDTEVELRLFTKAHGSESLFNLKRRRHPYGKNLPTRVAQDIIGYAVAAGYDFVALPESKSWSLQKRTLTDSDSLLTNPRNEIALSWDPNDKDPEAEISLHVDLVPRNQIDSEEKDQGSPDDYRAKATSTHPDIGAAAKALAYQSGADAETANKIVAAVQELYELDTREGLPVEEEGEDFVRRVEQFDIFVQTDPSGRSELILSNLDTDFVMRPGRPELERRYNDLHRGMRTELARAYGRMVPGTKEKNILKVGKPLADQAIRISRGEVRVARAGEEVSRKTGSLPIDVVVYPLNKAMRNQYSPSINFQKDADYAGASPVLRGFTEYDKVRGKWNIFLTPHANRSTLIHEIAHYLTFKLPDSSQQDMATWLKEPNSDPHTWQRESHELIARTVEAILRDGSIPVAAEPAEFLPLWIEISAALRSVYPTVANSPLPRLHPRFFDIYERFFFGDASAIRAWLQHPDAPVDSGPGLPPDKPEAEMEVDLSEPQAPARQKKKAKEKAERKRKSKGVEEAVAEPAEGETPTPPTDSDLLPPQNDAIRAEDIEAAIREALEEEQAKPKKKKAAKRKPSEVAPPPEKEEPIRVIPAQEAVGGAHVRISPLYWKSRILRIAEGLEAAQLSVARATLHQDQGEVTLDFEGIPPEFGSALRERLKKKDIPLHFDSEEGVWKLSLPTPIKIPVKEGTQGVIAADSRLFSLAEEFIRAAEIVAPSVQLPGGGSFEIGKFTGFPRDTHAESLSDIHSRYKTSGNRQLTELESATVAVLQAIKRGNAAVVNREIHRFAGINSISTQEARDAILSEALNYQDKSEKDLPTVDAYLARKSGEERYEQDLDSLRGSTEEVYRAWAKGLAEAYERDEARSRLRARAAPKDKQKEAALRHTPLGLAVFGAAGKSEKAIRHLLDMQKNGATPDEMHLFLRRLVDANGGEIKLKSDFGDVRIVIASDGYPDFYHIGEGPTGDQVRKAGRILATSRIMSALKIPRVESDERAKTEMGEKLTKAIKAKVSEAEKRRKVEESPYAPEDLVMDIEEAPVEEAKPIEEVEVPAVDPDGIDSQPLEKVAAGFQVGRTRRFNPEPSKLLDKDEGVYLSPMFIMNGNQTWLIRHHFLRESLSTIPRAVELLTQGEQIQSAEERKREMEIQALIENRPESEEIILPEVPQLTSARIYDLMMSGENKHDWWVFGNTFAEAKNNIAAKLLKLDQPEAFHSLIEDVTTNPSKEYPGRREVPQELRFVQYYAWQEGSKLKAGAVLTDEDQVYVVDANTYDFLVSQGGKFVVSRKMAHKAKGGDWTVLGVLHRKSADAISSVLGGPTVFEALVGQLGSRAEEDVKQDPEIGKAFDEAYRDPTASMMAIVLTHRKYNLGLSNLSLSEIERASKRNDARSGEIIRLEQRDILDPEGHWSGEDAYVWKGQRPRRRRVYGAPLPLSEPTAKPVRFSKRDIAKRVRDLKTLMSQIQERFDVRLDVGKVFFGHSVGETFQKKYGPKVLDVYMYNAYGEVGRVIGTHFYDIDGWKPEDINDPLVEGELFKLGLPHFNVDSLSSAQYSKVRKRGAEEFMRIYLIDSDVAKAAAPHFWATFENRLGMHPEWTDNLKWLSQHFAMLRSLTPSEQLDLMIDFDGSIADAINPPLSALDKFMVDIVDQQWPLAKMQNVMAGKPGYEVTQRFEESFRIVNGSADIASAWWRWGITDADGNPMKDRKGKVPRSLDKIWGDASAAGYREDFAKYLVARRIVDDLAPRGLGSVLRVEDAKSFVEDIETNPKTSFMKDLAGEQYSFWETVTAKLKEEGVYSEAEIDAIEKLNKAYVPYRHIVAHMDSSIVFKESARLKTLSKGFGGRKSMPLYDPMKVSLSNLADIAQSVMQRRALHKMAAQADLDGAQDYLRKVPPPPRKLIASDLEAIRDQLEKFGIEIPDTIYRPVTGSWAFQKGSKIVRSVGPSLAKLADANISRGATLRLSDGTIATVANVIDEYSFEMDVEAPRNIHGGKLRIGVESELEAASALLNIAALQSEYTSKRRIFKTYTFDAEGNRITHYWEVLDEALWDAMRLNPDVGAAAFTLMSKTASMLRMGATLSIDFIARNPFRDIQQAMALSKHQPKIPFIGHVVDASRALAHILGHGEWYRRFMESGGSQAELISNYKSSISDLERKLLNRDTAHSWRRTIITNPTEVARLAVQLFNPIEHAIVFLSGAAKATEQISRVAEFKRAYEYAQEKLQMDHVEASTYAGAAARDVTVDFRRYGRKSKQWNKVTPFFTATIAGQDKLRRSLVTDADRHKAWGHAVMYYLLPSILTWWANHDDPEWQEIQSWEKNSFWLIKAPEEIRGADPSIRFIRIPKPRGFEPIFGIPVEMMLEEITGSDPDAYYRLQEMIGDIPKDLAARFVPLLVLPLIEAYANYSIFRGGHIVGQFDAKLSPELQTSYWTSETARSWARYLPRSMSWLGAADIDHIIYGYTGGLGRSLVSGVDNTFLPALGLGKNKEPGEAPPALPYKTWWSQLPGVRGFLSMSPKSAANSISRYYQSEAQIGEVSRVLKSKNPYLLKRQLVLNPEMFQTDDATGRISFSPLARRVKYAKAGIDKISQAIRDVFENGDLNPEQKRGLLDALYERKTVIARWAIGRTPDFKGGRYVSEGN